MDDQLTPEQIAKHYSACLDSVWVINDAIANPDRYTTDDTVIERNALLAASDWTQVADAPVDQAAWAAYRQALRDVTDQVGFPDNVTWPIAPE